MTTDPIAKDSGFFPIAEDADEKSIYTVLRSRSGGYTISGAISVAEAHPAIYGEEFRIVRRVIQVFEVDTEGEPIRIRG